MLEEIKQKIDKSAYINTVIYYGTSLNSFKEGEDFDIAIILSIDNEINKECFLELIELRKQLSIITKQDIDLIPHTLDEVDDVFSPIYNPRYNPSLVYGTILKGTIKIEETRDRPIKQSDILKTYISLDRTIIRRLICRDYSQSDNMVFINKIKKTMFNIINYLSIKNNINYYNLDENEVSKNIAILDLIYGSSFKERLTKLFFIVQNNTFEELLESEKIKFKTNIGIITEKIFKSFFTKEVDLSQFDLRIKSILSKKEQNRIIE